IVGKHGGNGFAGVDGAAAAETDHHLATLLSRLLDALLDCLDFGLAEYGKVQTSDPMLTKCGQEGLSAAGIAAGDNQSAMAEFLGVRADLAQRTDAEDNARCCAEFKVHAKPHYDSDQA